MSKDSSSANEYRPRNVDRRNKIVLVASFALGSLIPVGIKEFSATNGDNISIDPAVEEVADTFASFSPNKLDDFKSFIGHAKSIRLRNRHANASEVDVIVSDTLKLAEDRIDFPGDPNDFDANWHALEVQNALDHFSPISKTN